MNSDASIAAHLSSGINVNKTSLVLFISIWWITDDMLVISVVEKFFRLGLKYLIAQKSYFTVYKLLC